jgi:HAD superfamily hydrolase (TIGR01549 family)
MNKTSESHLNNIKVISWDLDGTLYDAKVMKSQLLRLWIRALWKPSAWRDIIDILSSQRMVKNIHRNGGDYAHFFNKKVRMRAEEAEKKWFHPALISTGLRKGIPAALDFFHQQGVQQIIVSDYRPEYKLQALNISNAFTHTYACENHHHLKPSPAVFEIVCTQLGVLPEEILHIGDRLDTDGLSAKNAGCRFHHLPRKAVMDADTVLKDLNLRLSSYI